MSLKKLVFYGAALVTCTIHSGAAKAASIVQDKSDYAVPVNVFQPIGQSFTAVDTSLKSVGFKFTAIGPVYSPPYPISVALYEGVGTTGALLANRSLTLEGADLSGFIDFDFGGVPTVVGQQYSAALYTYRDSFRYGLEFERSDVYSGGALFSSFDPPFTLLGCSAGGCDARFRVLGATVSAVPEPATWAMMMAGFGIIGGAARRRRRVSAKSQFA